MPRGDERDQTKRDADRAVNFFDRLLARGLSRKEAVDLTVAYLLGQKVQLKEEDREPWQRGDDDRG